MPDWLHDGMVTKCFEPLPEPLLDGFGWSLIGALLVVVAIRIGFFICSRCTK